MKIATFLILISLLTGTTWSQTNLQSLGFNNVQTVMSNRGTLAFDPQLSAARYEVPNGGGNHVLFAFSPLWSATDANGNLKGAFSYYNMQTTMHGPISNDYSSQWQAENSDVYTVYSNSIQTHINDHAQNGYTMPTGIENWPAVGNVAENGSDFLAPFEDFNLNGVYDPENGDYPIVYGDAMSFTIFNYDTMPSPTLSNNTPTPLEVQMGTYQFASNDDLNNVTFVYYRVENKSEDTLFDFRWGNMADFDVGDSQDDYIGSDESRNLVYAYNGTNNDPGGNGAPGYGDYPPAAGIISLNNSMYVINHVGDQVNNPDHEINTMAEFHNIMQGANNQGIPNTDDNGDPVKMLYNENPNVGGSYSEHQLGNTPSERRVLYNTEPNDLNPGESKCYHFAIIYKRSIGTNNIEIVDSLLATADFVQSFFDTAVAPDCYQKPTLSLSQNDFASESFKIFPNPANDFISLKSNSELVKVMVFDYTGKKVQQENSKNFSISSLSKGVYSVQAITKEGDILQSRFVKE